jgi:hypothetical protein
MFPRLNGSKMSGWLSMISAARYSAMLVTEVLSLSGSCEQTTIGEQLSSLQIPKVDRTHGLGFRALRTDNGAGSVELTRT